jgi:catechol 2,3-dioxygenase-like lactoylglutathione lyase family enzyme
MSTGGTSRITGVASVTVVVADLERALAFYVGELGMVVRRDVDLAPGVRWVEVAPTETGTSIALISTASGIPVGIRLGTVDADAQHAALRAHGADVDEQVLRMDGVAPPMFTVRDPDGNTLVLVEDAG